MFPFIAFSQSQDYLGKWRNSDTTELVEIISDTIYYYEIVDSCYNLDKIPFTDSGNNTLTLSVAGQSYPVNYTLQDGNSVLNMTSAFDNATYYSYDFTIDDYEPCSDSSNTNSNYQGKWKTTSPVLMYLEFTTDSVFVYRFDSVGCYTLNYLTCSDQGNSQLLISGVITTNYTLSDNGEEMAIDIVGLGDLELERYDFNPDQWVECTYNWKCNTTTGCEEVGLLEGNFNNQQDCQAACQIDTTTIQEYILDIDIYPNPFSDYATLDFKDKVNSYQLYDVYGRLLLSKSVSNSVEYLHKGSLSQGVYFLQFIGDKKASRVRVVME